MPRPDHLATLEVVKLADGRYSVQEIGSLNLPEDSPVFDSEAEAQAWLLQQDEFREEAAFDSDILKPGSGQGLR